MRWRNSQTHKLQRWNHHTHTTWSHWHTILFIGDILDYKYLKRDRIKGICDPIRCRPQTTAAQYYSMSEDSDHLLLPQSLQHLHLQVWQPIMTHHGQHCVTPFVELHTHTHTNAHTHRWCFSFAADPSGLYETSDVADHVRPVESRRGRTSRLLVELRGKKKQPRMLHCHFANLIPTWEKKTVWIKKKTPVEAQVRAKIPVQLRRRWRNISSIVIIPGLFKQNGKRLPEYWADPHSNDQSGPMDDGARWWTDRWDLICTEGPLRGIFFPPSSPTKGLDASTSTQCFLAQMLQIQRRLLDNDFATTPKTFSTPVTAF